jgi:hypothetical protein
MGCVVRGDEWEELGGGEGGFIYRRAGRGREIGEVSDD